MTPAEKRVHKLARAYCDAGKLPADSTLFLNPAIELAESDEVSDDEIVAAFRTIKGRFPRAVAPKTH